MLAVLGLFCLVLMIPTLVLGTGWGIFLCRAASDSGYHARLAYQTQAARQRQWPLMSWQAKLRYYLMHLYMGALIIGFMFIGLYIVAEIFAPP